MTSEELNVLLAQGRGAAHGQLDPLTEAYGAQLRKAGRRMASRVRDTEPRAVTADASGWQPPTLEELLAAASLAITAGGVQILRRKAAKEAMAPVTAAVDEAPEAERLTYVMEKLSSRADELVTGLRDPVNKALVQARSDGLSIRQTARLIQDTVDGVAPWQANLIARTDLLAVSNLASDQSVKQANAAFRKAGETEFSVKRWLTAHDERVRPNHAAAEHRGGVSIDQPFLVGASSMMFPCDPNGSPDETWNCRCVCTYHEQDALIASGDPFLDDLMEHMTRRIEEPGDASAAIVDLWPLTPEQAAFMDELYALPLEERLERIGPILFPPPAALPSPETQEDSMSGKTEAFVTLTPQFGVGVFATDSNTVSASANPIAFIPITPTTEIFDNKQNSTEGLTAAVTITVAENETEEVVGEPIPWEGVLAVEGVKSGDSTYAPRILLPGSVSHRELPLPLMAQTVTADGHDGARLSGKIEKIWRADRPDLGEGAVAIMGSGVFHATAIGQEIASLVDDKSLRGVSVDLVAAQYQIVTADDLTPIPDDEVDLDVLMNGGYLLGLVSGDIGAATLCPLQALEDATISLVAAGAERATAFSFFGIHLSDALVASAAPVAPPKEWFFRPEPHEITPMTVTKDGQVFGHAATWDCHEGFRDRCMLAPRSRTNLAYFHVGEIETAEGECIPIGKWTVRGPHAPVTMSRAQAQSHYDNASTVVAFVRALEGRHGIWVSGCLKSDATAEQIRDARANPPSGDWRAGELLLIHSVPAPGLPVLRHEARVMVASDGSETVAALITPPVEDCDCVDEMSIAEYEIRIEALGQLAGIEV